MITTFRENPWSAPLLMYATSTSMCMLNVRVESHGKTILSEQIAVQGEEEVKWPSFGEAKNPHFLTRQAWRDELVKFIGPLLDRIAAERIQI